MAVNNSNKGLGEEAPQKTEDRQWVSWAWSLESESWGVTAISMASCENYKDGNTESL